MLYYLSLFSHDSGFAMLNVFKYLSFRALGAASTSLILSWLFGPLCIRLLRRLKLGQPLRSKDEVRELADLHKQKKNTPTMGGILILTTVTISVLLWCNLANHLVWLVLAVMLFLGFLGFTDDYTKVAKKNSKGISAREKLIGQFFAGAFVYEFLIYFLDKPSALYVPFFKEPILLHMGLLALPFFIMVIVGSSNAVNITDGLDGLAIGCTITVTLTYAVFCYLESNYHYATYLFLPISPNAGDLAIYCAAMVGSGMGFLWFNCHPARMFMGDTGSLAIGGTLGVIAICVHQELCLVIAGGVFVMEAMSVVIQVISFKTTGQRVFKMSPLHHHFELSGWAETTVTVRFWIMSVAASILALSTLKLR